MNDYQIAQQTTILPIKDLAAKFGIEAADLKTYGANKAKIAYDYQNNREQQGKIILVSAISPTPAGEGKTTTAIGLIDGLNSLDYQAVGALREPSMGPVFGLKGGACGGGYAQVTPMTEINLHFTGDFAAIAQANNLLAAAIDNVIYWGNHLDIDPEKIVFKRCIDLNDRSLREISYELKPPKREAVKIKAGFNITAASELMAIFCLAKDRADLIARIDRILVAYNRKNEPIFASELGISSALAAVLKDAFDPNLVQTLEHNLVFMHGGPFANIAHGCNSLVATKLACRMADYVVTEAGFGADLGLQKFFDIKGRIGRIKPAIVVLVATIRALKYHGGVALEDLQIPNVQAVATGLANLKRHIQIVKKYGSPIVVALNQFASDDKAELELVAKSMAELGIPFALNSSYLNGGKGAQELAKTVIATLDKQANPNEIVNDEKVNESNIEAQMLEIAKEVYGAANIEYSELAKRQLIDFQMRGWDKLPVCMAKTPASLSDDPKLINAPTDFTLHIRELRPNLGAGFIVALTGKVLTMPGLPKKPAALNIKLEAEEIVGLF